MKKAEGRGVLSRLKEGGGKDAELGGGWRRLKVGRKEEDSG